MAILPAIGSGNFADPRQARDFVDPNKGWPTLEINFGVEVAGFDGDGINKYYPSPKEYRGGTADGSTAPSGVFVSYPPALSNPAYTTHTGSKGSGIFNFRNLISGFSNGPESKAATDGINNFTIFNDYIHYFIYDECPDGTSPILTVPPEDECVVRIRFVADMIPTSHVFDRYKEIE